MLTSVGEAGKPSRHSCLVYRKCGGIGTAECAQIGDVVSKLLRTLHIEAVIHTADETASDDVAVGRNTGSSGERRTRNIEGSEHAITQHVPVNHIGGIAP